MFDLNQNKFFIKGDSGIKYSHNNGKIAEDPKLATINFLNALEQYKTKTEKLEVDIPVLENILKGTWRKEDELHSVKSELATLDRQIQLSLTKVSQREESEQQEPNLEPTSANKILIENSLIIGRNISI